MSEKAIKESKIGMSIGKIANKNEDGYKAKEAGDIVYKWKQDVENQRLFEKEERQRLALEAEIKALTNKYEDQI